MKKDDEAESGGFLFHLDKSTVLQEARVFNETPIKPSRCCATLTKVLYLMHQGEVFHVDEATNLFFAITKLFQCKDTQLRKMVYLIIKELSKIAQDVIMATSSLTKDMNDKVAAEIGYRSNAIRALCCISDASSVQSIERFIKQAMVDKDSNVASSAMVSAIHLYNRGGKEVVKRWVNEAQEALTRPNGSVQYHALGLMYQIRQHDKMAVIKTVQQLSRGNSLRSQYAYCMLIRYTYKIMQDDGGMDGPSRGMIEVLENCLRNRYEMVNLEAARAISTLKGVTSKELFPVVAVMQLFLNSPKSTLRFASVRTLSKLAMTHPDAVSNCNLDMENLITDTNRSIATFAITTLLKTGNEASVDRLMKQITGFMAEISDEFKVIVVDAIRALCLKFPAKHGMMVTFLSTSLRDEGGYDFKRAIVEAIFDIIAAIPESKETSMAQLCEFIEDCEFTRLSVRILRLIGEEGPGMALPSKYIRFIYNRTILENAPVRAAAVSALAKFTAAPNCDPGLRKNIRVLLNRCLDDPDDEVRDRAVMHVRILDDQEHGDEIARSYVTNDSIYSMATLEAQLAAYCADPKNTATPFDITSIPVITRAQDLAGARAKSATAQFAQNNGLAPTTAASAAQKSTAASPVPGAADGMGAAATLLQNVPQFSSFGPVFHSSAPVELTETDVAEYVVSCQVYTFVGHIVFQFNCKNTLDDVQLEQVTVQMEAVDEALAAQLQLCDTVPIPKLPFDTPAATYVAFKKVNGADDYPLGAFTNTLKFVSKDCDAQTGVVDDEGYDDTYLMENVELAVSHYIVPSYLAAFAKVWDQLGDTNEVVETFQLETVNNVKDAITAMMTTFGMAACENSDQLPRAKPAASITSHTLMMSGKFLGGVQCLCRVRMACAASCVTIECSVRSEREDVSVLLAECVV